MLGKEGNNDRSISQLDKQSDRNFGGGWVFLFFIVFYSLYSSSLFC